MMSAAISWAGLLIGWMIFRLAMPVAIERMSP